MSFRLVAIFSPLLIFASPLSASARERSVSSAAEVREAFETAVAGDTITVAPGTYNFDASIWTSNDGTPGQPITVRAARLGEVKFDFQSVEALVINNAYWVLDHLWINAACANPSDCQAGVGVKPPAIGFVLQGSRTTNWYQHVKAAREVDAEVSDASIIGCEMYNEIARYSQVIDIVGGKRWRIAGNYVHDWNGSDNGAFGIFLKGDSSDGVIEQNLVLCAADRAPSGGAMVGISLGQGGTGAQYCPDGACVCEDRNSIVRNNIVAHCSDTGLHALRACGGKFLNNTVYDTGAGFQIQEDSPNAPVEIHNNLMNKRIFGGTNYVESNDLQNADEALFREIYAAPDANNFAEGGDTLPARDLGMSLADASFDYCGRERDGVYDFGAVEFPSACVTWPWTSDRVPVMPPVDPPIDPPVDPPMNPPVDPPMNPPVGTVDPPAGPSGPGTGPVTADPAINDPAAADHGELRGGCVCVAGASAPNAANAANAPIESGALVLFAGALLLFRRRR